MKKPSNLLIFTVLCLDHPLEAFSSEQDNIVDNHRLRLARQTGETSSPRWGVSRSLHPPPPHPHKSGSSSYKGCLKFSDSELKSAWIFKSDPPECSYHHHGGGGGGSASGGGGGGGSSGGGGTSSSGGGGGSSGGGSSSGGAGNSSGGNGSGGESDGSGGGGSESNSNGGDGSGGGNGDSDVKGQDGNDDEYDDTDDYFSNNDANGSKDDDYVVGNGGNGGNDDDGNGGGNGDNDPMASFNIEECDTFASLWMYDLSFTCESLESFENCECTFAEELMDQGALTCDDISLCPEECGVCETCLRILGCDAASANGFNSTRTRNLIFYVVAAAIGTIAIAGVVYTTAIRKGDDDSLGEQLMHEPPAPAVWLAPTTPSFEMQDGVPFAPSPSFEAPTIPPAQFAPAVAAAVASQEDEDGISPNEYNVWLAPVGVHDGEQA